MLKDLLRKNRSYRRFYQDVRLTREELVKWIACVRLCPSGCNAQPLRYKIVTDEATCAQVFPALAWAGFLPDWAGPVEGERPAAYLVQLLDTRVMRNSLCDDGIQAQTLLLAAVESGYGGCIIKSFREELLLPVLQLPEYLKILHVIALGRPKETVVLEEMQGEDYKYWRTADGVHHVPKRGLDSLIVD